MNKKRLLADTLFGRLRAITVPLSLAARRRRLTVLAYHRVFEPPGGDYPFVPGNISATPAEFERQVEFLAAHFQLMNFRMLDEALREDAVPPHPAILTFDDGYRDNHDIVTDILTRHGATATVFLSTGFIDSGEPFWFDRVAYQFYRMKPRRVALRDRYLHTVKKKNREASRRAFQHVAGRVSNAERLTLIEELEAAGGVKMTEAHFDLARPLTWEQVRAMSDAGIEIGSHTVSHPYLSRLTDDELRHELLHSKQSIKEHTGQEVLSVAYPAGFYNERVLECARRCGYRFGITYRHDTRPYDESAAHEIPRIRIDSGVDFSLFLGNILFPRLFLRSLKKHRHAHARHKKWN